MAALLALLALGGPLPAKFVYDLCGNTPPKASCVKTRVLTPWMVNATNLNSALWAAVPTYRQMCKVGQGAQACSSFGVATNPLARITRDMGDGLSTYHAPPALKAIVLEDWGFDNNLVKFAEGGAQAGCGLPGGPRYLWPDEVLAPLPWNGDLRIRAGQPYTSGATGAPAAPPPLR